MQLRENDIILNETPKSMIEHPTEDTHALTGVTDDNKQIRIHLLLRGVTSTMTVSKPTLEQFETLPRLVLTNQDLEWDPQNKNFQIQEEAYLNNKGEFIPAGDRKRKATNNNFVLETTRTKRLSIATLNERT